SKYGRVASALDRVAERLRYNRYQFASGKLRRVGHVLRVIVLARVATTRARTLGRDTVVVVMSDVDLPALIAAFAGRGRWLVYVGRAPHRPMTRIGRLANLLVHRLVAMAERSRRRRGGRFVLG